MMFRFLFVMSYWICANAAVNGQVISAVDFETDFGFTTSISEFTDGDEDYFFRTDGSDLGSAIDYGTPQGNFFFAAQDIDGEGADLQQSLFISDIDISGFVDLSLGVLISEDDAPSGESWDRADAFEIFASIDGGTQFQIFGVRNSGATFNGSPLVDTDFDGIGDGTEIVDSSVNFNADILGIGNNLDLEFRFSLGAEGEDLAIDNVRVTGLAVPEPTSTVVMFLTGLGLLGVRRK